MRLVHLIIFLACAWTGPVLAQDTKAPSLCKPWLDSLQSSVTHEEAIAWADNPPIRVACDDGTVYTLSKFDISVFTRNPLQTRQFGTGEEGGIPLLARRALDNLKTGDAFILKNAVYVDAQGAEHALPVISFSIE